MLKLLNRMIDLLHLNDVRRNKDGLELAVTKTNPNQKLNYEGV